MTSDEQDAVLLEIEKGEERKRVIAEREREKVEARIHRKEIKAEKKKAAQVKQRAILESAFADSDDDNSSGSDWFEADLEFDGSDDEGL